MNRMTLLEILLNYNYSIDFNKMKVYTQYSERSVRGVVIEIIPEWMGELEEEDLAFIRRFLLASGSLKEVARQYGVTYPTVRLRLDRLIQKIQISEHTAAEPYIALIKRLTVNDKMDVDTAKLLIHEYKKLHKEESV